MAEGFDYVIVGGGTAGCVLANRLSANKSARVLLLEAGGPDSHPLIHMPVGFAKMTDGPFTWGYTSVAQKQAENREILLPQGRVLGGGGSINALIYARGTPADYDRWENEYGCKGWSFKDVLPYFIRCEDNDRLSEPLHGIGGYLGVSDLVSPHPLTKAFVRAGQEYGLPFNDDFNGKTQHGVGFYQTTTRNSRRCSAAAGYLKPVLKRPNLTVRTRSLALRIIMENKRAVGVEYIHNGLRDQAHASQEVIVASGAIGSPKLLMLSGIGKADDLTKLGIEMQADVAAVGSNLHDHYDIDILYELQHKNSLDRYRKWYWAAWAGVEYLLFGSGPVTSNVAEGAAFSHTRRNKPGEYPDYQLHFLPGAGLEAGVPSVPSGAGCTMNFYYVQPKSRGSVKLQSADAQVSPLIDPNYLAEKSDREASIEVVEQARAIMQQPSMAFHISREHHPGEQVKTDEDILAYLRRRGRTAYHHVGTCRMGSDSDAVVDPQLRVNGIERLRVIDSSIMPQIVSANTNAASFMIGEKGSDLVLADASPKNQKQKKGSA